MKRIALALLIASPATAQDTTESALARATLSALQTPSIAENREYCGYIGLDAAGNYVASPATPGDNSSCLPEDLGDVVIPTASYHTHAAYSSGYDSEVPSGDDIEGDEAEGIDGYVSTPGGRFWYIDTEARELSQLCGVGCLPADPNFRPETAYTVEQSYTFDDLIILLGG